MPSLSTILKLSLTILAVTRAQGSPATNEETDTSEIGSASTTSETKAIRTLPHDAVVSMPQLIPANMDGTLYLTYQPILKVRRAFCAPFPAVDVQGRIGRGLKPTSYAGSGCEWSVGQVYVRSTFVGKWFAILSVWYFPKDYLVRHDWDGVVLLLKSRQATDAANVFAVCPSANGKWTCSTKFLLNGTFPLIDYNVHKDEPGPRSHTCYLTEYISEHDTPGTHQPLVVWESIPKAAAEALSNYDYGEAQVLFIEAHFNATMALITPPPEVVQTLPHDHVVALPQLTPEGRNGTLYLTYQPYLKVFHGCVPFPAVDAQGRIGHGLKPTGPSGGHHSKCHKSVGQVYVRSARVGDLFALLYTWYQPKDQRGRHGKRNDWEGAVVYLKSRYATDAANILAVCPSALGTWTCLTKFSLDGTSPLIEYTIRGESRDNTCYLSERPGTKQPLAAWESIPRVAAEALANYDFGKSQVPFIDAHFNATLALAVPPV